MARSAEIGAAPPHRRSRDAARSGSAAAVSQTRLTALLALLVALTWSGCGGTQKVGTPADQARSAYDQALEYFEDGNYLEAINSFNVVRTRHPYSRFATLAELKIADSYYELGKYVEAAAAYRSFVRFHPHHTQRPYALYRVGECYFQMIPGDWWFMPPAHERELGTTRDALRELQTFVETYPAAEQVPEARKKIDKLQLRLAEYEMYVARFYWKRNKPRATVLRLQYLLDRYPETSLVPEALLLLARAHLALEAPEDARQVLDRLLREHPDTAQAREARKELGKLQSDASTTSSASAPS